MSDELVKFYFAETGKAIKKGDFNNAVLFSNEIIRLKPSSYRAYVNKGLAYASLGAKCVAESAYKKALSMNPHPDHIKYIKFNLACILEPAEGLDMFIEFIDCAYDLQALNLIDVVMDYKQ